MASGKLKHYKTTAWEMHIYVLKKNNNADSDIICRVPRGIIWISFPGKTQNEFCL